MKFVKMLLLLVACIGLIGCGDEDSGQKKADRGNAALSAMDSMRSQINAHLKADLSFYTDQDLLEAIAFCDKYIAHGKEAVDAINSSETIYYGNESDVQSNISLASNLKYRLQVEQDRRAEYAAENAQRAREQEAKRKEEEKKKAETRKVLLGEIKKIENLKVELVELVVVESLPTKVLVQKLDEQKTTLTEVLGTVNSEDGQKYLTEEDLGPVVELIKNTNSNIENMEDELLWRGIEKTIIFKKAPDVLSYSDHILNLVERLKSSNLEAEAALKRFEYGIEKYKFIDLMEIVEKEIVEQDYILKTIKKFRYNSSFNQGADDWKVDNFITLVEDNIEMVKEFRKDVLDIRDREYNLIDNIIEEVYEEEIEKESKSSELFEEVI